LKTEEEKLAHDSPATETTEAKKDQSN